MLPSPYCMWLLVLEYWYNDRQWLMKRHAGFRGQDAVF